MNPLAYLDPDDPYPSSDGQPMAENTDQYDWLVRIKENLEVLFADRADVFVAGDLLWYPAPDRRISGPIAPDVMVAFGRPKGPRPSYKQWEEDGIPPQVVFEIRSPANSVKEMADKLAFYDLYGVEEYYVYDPADKSLRVWIRQGGPLAPMAFLGGWTSPRLGVRFTPTPTGLDLFHPNGEPFLTTVELTRRARLERQRAEQEREMARQERERAEEERLRAERERERAEHERARAESESERAEHERARADSESERARHERERAERLAARLRRLGLDPDSDD